jgi:hypothetical protein
LATKRQEHQDLDRAISALTELNSPNKPVDQLELRRLKKKKLSLKDEIRALEERFFPNIIA